MANVAVIIVNTNEGHFLDRTLAALAGQTAAPARTIVVDNGSTDGSTERLEARPDVEVVALGRNVGFAAANNVGVRLADDCDLVALLNADAFPEPGWLETLTEAATAHPAFVAFASRMLKAIEPQTLDGAGDVYHVCGLAWRRDRGRAAASSEHSARSGEVFSVCAGAGMYRREAFLEAGGFDEDFFVFSEDTDLAFRLRLAGHRCWYAHEATVLHVGSGKTGARSPYSVYLGHRNLVWTYAKNMPWPLLIAYFPQHLALNVVTIALYVARRQVKTILAAKRDALRGLPGMLRKRRSIQRRRRVGSLALRRAMNRGADIRGLGS